MIICIAVILRIWQKLLYYLGNCDKTMKINVNFLFISAISLFFVIGCGQKGDLYLPDVGVKKERVVVEEKTKNRKKTSKLTSVLKNTEK